MTKSKYYYLDELASLRRRRDEILIPIIKASIPEGVLASFIAHPKYFNCCTTVEVSDGLRSIVTNINQLFPSEDCIINIDAPSCVLDEIISIDNRLENLLKTISKLKRLTQ